MKAYKPWITIKVTHDYFLTNKSNIALEPEAKTRKLFEELGIILRNVNDSEWILFKQDNLTSSNNSELAKNLKFYLKAIDPNFYYYTNSELIVDSNFFKIKNTEKKGAWKELEILAHLVPLENQDITIKIHSLCKFFEFIIIPKPNSQSHVMKLTEEKNSLTFNSSEVDILKQNKSVCRFVSSEKVCLKESYDYKISLWEVSEKGNKMLQHGMPFPNSSAVSVLNSEDTISSYLYF